MIAEEQKSKLQFILSQVENVWNRETIASLVDEGTYESLKRAHALLTPFGPDQPEETMEEFDPDSEPIDRGTDAVMDLAKFNELEAALADAIAQTDPR
jgi:hypothetical protein